MKIAHIVKLLFAIYISSIVISCSKSESPTTTEIPKSSAKQITSFVFLLSDNPIAVNVVGNINEEMKSITAQMPPNTDISALLPEIKISDKASINIETIRDFNQEVEYLVTAEDGSTATYMVFVEVLLSERQVLQVIVDANVNNLLNWDIDNTADLNDLNGVTTDIDGNVTQLNFLNHGLTIIPPEIAQLKHLKNLTISNGPITSIPKEIGNIEQLEILEITGTAVTQIPSEIGLLNNLEELILRGSIPVFPNEIADLSNLKKLQLISGSMTALPSGINQLQQLISLEFGSNLITIFPSEILGLENLKELYIFNSPLQEIPKEIGTLDQLQALGMSGTEVTDLPLEIALLTNLTDLIIRDNLLLENIPPEIAFLPNLQDLHLSRINRETTIPQSVCNLEEQGRLTIHDSPIPGNDYHTCETVSIKDALISIYTANPNNTLGWGPDNYPEVSFDENENPTVINLNNANITTIPDNINFITTLETLNANSNNLEELPVSISELSNLTVMNFANNQLQTVPMEFGYMTDLALLNLTNNPITSIPSAVCDLRISTGGGMLTLLTDPGEGCD